MGKGSVVMYQKVSKWFDKDGCVKTHKQVMTEVETKWRRGDGVWRKANGKTSNRREVVGLGYCI